MPTKAPRLPACLWQGWACGALLMLGLWLAEAAAATETILSAWYTEPTRRYAHGILGDAIEYGTLEIRVEEKSSEKSRLKLDLVYKPSRYTVTIRLPADRVFEDIAPRLVDINGDGSPEVIVVESQENTGAQLAIYDASGYKIAATPHIGTRNRWLAPIGAADLDGDGNMEIAYIDRPHLAKTLRIWRFANGNLTEIASLPDLTNHKIGEDFISGGIRTCGAAPDMILVNGNWTRIISVSYQNGWAKADLGPFNGPDSLTSALNC